MENKKSKQEIYNESRKRETKSKLLAGVRAIARSNKKVTKYGLSKKTGISRRIIDNYPEVLEAIRKANLENERSLIKEVSIDSSKINNIDELRILLDALQNEYNQLQSKYNSLIVELTQRDQEKAKLLDEVNEMKQYLMEKGKKNDKK